MINTALSIIGVAICIVAIFQLACLALIVVLMPFAFIKREIKLWSK